MPDGLGSLALFVERGTLAERVVQIGLRGLGLLRGRLIERREEAGQEDGRENENENTSPHESSETGEPAASAAGRSADGSQPAADAAGRRARARLLPRERPARHLGDGDL